MSNFSIVSTFKGYINKPDLTNVASGFLVAGSQNVLITEGSRIASRKGYTLDGQANTANYPIVSSYEWTTHLGTELPLRAWNNRLEFRWSSDGQWYLLKTFGSSGSGLINFNFAEWWDVTNVQDLLLIVNGSSNIYDWTGGIATFASATANTITLQGSSTWTALGFATSGTRSVVISGVEYAYTGGEGTATITGVTPDPTVGAYAVGTVIAQGIRTQANSAITSTNVVLPATFPNDLIAVLSNQIYLGCTTRRTVFMSKVNSKTDFSKSSPRLPGEGEVFILDDPPVGFTPQEDTMYISGGQISWYSVGLTLSSDLTKETVVVKKLKTNSRLAARSQAAIAKSVNDVVFVTKVPSFSSLGRLQQVDLPQTVTLSDPIKLDFLQLNFANCHVKNFQDNVFIALPSEGRVLIYNEIKGWWEAPQILPVRRFAIYEGALYGHSSTSPETYKLFEGYNDNSNPIDVRMFLSYENYGDRTALKNFDEEFVEGYMTSNTKITVTEYYDYGGASGVLSKEINGADTNLIFEVTEDYSLATHNLAEVSLGGGGGSVVTLPPKFRAIRTFQKINFYERQVEFSSNEVDQQWEILAYGASAVVVPVDDSNIKD